MASDDLDPYGPSFWDAFYAARTEVWSGRPSAYLVDRAAALPAGRALDVGCGEGADAIWLAQQGWQVTALDVSVVALERGRTRAEATGAEVADRIGWRAEDLMVWTPPVGAFDLVTAHFMQLPSAVRAPVYGKLAAAVAVGGTLLVVGHHPSDPSAMPREHGDKFFTAEEIAGGLDPEAWELVQVEAVWRPEDARSGAPATIHDAVLQARRRR